MTDAILIIILLLIVLFALREMKKRLKGGCCGGGDEPIRFKPEDSNAAHYPYRMTVYIDGMTCEHCKARVENEFHSRPGFLAKVDLKKKCAVVRSKQPLDEDTVGEIVRKSGYTVVKCEEN